MQTAILLAITMVCWTGWNLFSKASTKTLSPQAIQFIFALCGIVAAPIFYCLLPKDTKWSWQGISFSVAAYVSTSIAVFAYINLISKNNVSFILPIANSYPVIVVLISTVFLGESYSWTKFAGLCLMLAGVFVSTR